MTRSTGMRTRIAAGSRWRFIAAGACLLAGNWALLIGAIGLLVTLVGNPDGVAGTAYWKRRAKRQRALAAAAAGHGTHVADVPPPRERAPVPSTATTSGETQGS